ncbi:MAG: antibiotic biosynthesis monooxygenase [Gaiellaceae bacterium]
MSVRLARYTVEPERCDEAVDAFMEASKEIAALGGLERGYLLVDSNEGSIVTLTVWADQASLDASDVRSAMLRQKAIGAVEGDVQSVQVFDVVHEFRS